MLETISNFLTKVDDLVWNIPLIVLILATGIFLTIRLKGLQITKLPQAIRNLIANEKSGTDGEVSSFAALCTALSATIGTGNIVGVATAIVAGGPGALFWMWIAALVGTATKYSECLLAVKYRVVAEDGHIVGGPRSGAGRTCPRRTVLLHRKGYGQELEVACQDLCVFRRLCRSVRHRYIYTDQRNYQCGSEFL